MNDEVITVLNDMKVRKSFIQEEIKEKKESQPLLFKQIKANNCRGSETDLVGDTGATVEDPLHPL